MDPDTSLSLILGRGSPGREGDKWRGSTPPPPPLFLSQILLDVLVSQVGCQKGLAGEEQPAPRGCLYFWGNQHAVFSEPLMVVVLVCSLGPSFQEHPIPEK